MRLYAFLHTVNLVEVFDMPPSEFLHAFALRGYLQTDACGGGAYCRYKERRIDLGRLLNERRTAGA